MVQCEFEAKTLKADADSMWVVLGFAEYALLVDAAMSLAGTDEPPLAGLDFGFATRLRNPADSEGFDVAGAALLVVLAVVLDADADAEAAAAAAAAAPAELEG